MKRFIPFLSVLFLAASAGAAELTIAPGESVKLTPFEEIAVTCKAGDPTAKKCLVQRCNNDTYPFAVRYEDGTSVTGNCYQTVHDVERILALLRTTGQCR